MKKSNSESDLIPLDHTPHSRAFVRKLNSPEYQEHRTAEILADNEIDTLMDEIAETRPDKVVKEENNFIKKVNKTRPAPVDRDFHELAKRVKRGGKKTRKRRKGTRKRKSKKKKSTRKKRRGGVAPGNSNAINNQWLAEQNRTRPRIVQRRSTVVHSAPLIQGLRQARILPGFYIDLAMTNLTNPQTVWTIDQEGRLDEIMDLVTERSTFFVNRDPDERRTIRRYLDEATEAEQALEEVDMDLAERYRNFIEQIRQLAN